MVEEETNKEDETDRKCMECCKNPSFAQNDKQIRDFISGHFGFLY